MPKPPKDFPKDSVFSEYRGLPRVGHEPESDPEARRYWSELFVPNAKDHYGVVPKDHPVHKYLAGYFGHSNVIQGWYRNDECVLSFNHVYLHHLALTMRGWEYDESLFTAFPITFRFSGVKEFHVIRSVEHFWFQMLRASRDNVFRNLEMVEQLRMPRLDADRVTFNGCFRSKSRFKCKKLGPAMRMGEDYCICISANTFELEEEFRQGWVEQMGKDNLDIMDDFLLDYKWNWGIEDYEDWLEKRGIPVQRQEW